MLTNISIPSNLANNFLMHGEKKPSQIALVEPLSDGQEKNWTFGELIALVSRFRHGLDRYGFKPGDRFVVILPVSAEFYAFLGALFANGVVPIFIDATMPPSQILRSIQLSNAKAIVSIKKLLRHRFYLPALWGRKLFCVDSDGGFFISSWQNLVSKETDYSKATAFISPEDHSLISFTTGTTGRPKGADRQHGIVAQQRNFSQKSWPKQKNDIDFCGFPLVVLMNLNWGITTVLPDMELSHPAKANAQKLLSQMHRWQVTRMSASPAVFQQLTSGSFTHNDIPKCFRSLVTGGASVPQWLAQKIQNLFTDSDNYIVYGSTEAEPIAGISMEEFLSSDDNGYLVGRPIEGLRVKILSPQKTPQKMLLDEPLPSHQVGEVLLNGPHVIKRYIGNDRANKETKLKDSQGEIWHRTGDLGYFDSNERIWLVGRTFDQVPVGENLKPTFPFEHKIENSIGGRRAALVLHPVTNRPTMVTEVEVSEKTQKWLSEKNMDVECLGTRLPVDPRHNWRIDRKHLKKCLRI